VGVTFFLPWWVGYFMALVSIFIWPHYYEAAVIVFWHELVFSRGALTPLWQWQFIRTATLLILTPFIGLAKRRIIFYH